MKRIGLFLLTIVISSATGFAQPGSQRQGQGPRFDPEDNAKRQTEEIGKYVTYTENQEAKVYALNLKHAQKMQEMRGKMDFRNMSESQRDEMQKAREAERVAMNKEMKIILTAGQYTQYEKYLQDREQRMRGRGQQQPPR